MLNQALGVIDEGHFSNESAHIRLKIAAVPTLSVAKAKDPSLHKMLDENNVAGEEKGANKKRRPAQL